jgi:hypothetical protein
MCCNQGKVRIEPLPKLPPKIEELFKGESEASKLFLRNIRKYNAQFAFGSIQVDDKTAFKVCGQVHRRVGVGAIMPERGCSKPKCVQVYFYDPEEQVQMRMSDKHKSKAEKDNEQCII